MYLAACWMTQHDFGAAGLSDDEAAQLEQLFMRMLTRQVEIKLGWPHNNKLPSQTYILKVLLLFFCFRCLFFVCVSSVLTPLSQGVRSEKDLVKMLGCRYERLYVTDHCRPRDSQVDMFVALVQKYHRRNIWFHIHW